MGVGLDFNLLGGMSAEAVDLHYAGNRRQPAQHDITWTVRRM